MNKPIVILGSTSDHGGHMVSASGEKFLTNGIPVCLEGDMHYCPLHNGNTPHGTTPIVSGCAIHATFRGKPIAIEGAVAGCGAILNGNLSKDSTLT